MPKKKPALGRPPSFESPEQLQSLIEGYYKSCKENTIKIVRSGIEIEVAEPLTVAGMADFLGVHRDTLHAYSAQKGSAFSDTIKKAITKIERDKVTRAMLGFYDKTIAIFDLKNNHGYVDRKEIAESGDTPDRTKTLAQLYEELENCD